MTMGGPLSGRDGGGAGRLWRRVLGAMALSAALLGAAVLAPAPAAAQTQPPQICVDPSGFCRSLIKPVCLDRVGSGALDVGGAARCELQFDQYRDCLGEIVMECGQPAPAIETATLRGAGSEGPRCSPEDARQLWDYLKSSTSVAELEVFVEDCAGTPQARMAAVRLEGIRQNGGAPAVLRAPAGPDPAVVRAVKAELARLKLYQGAADGVWSGAAESALRRAGERFGVTFRLPVSDATVERLSALETMIEVAGLWRGAYYYQGGRDPVSFEVTLRQRGAVFEGRVGEKNTFGAWDAVFLYADIEGRIDGDRVSFVKTYDGTGGVSHSVDYGGVYDAGSRSVKGTWWIGGESGDFVMYLE